MNLVPLFEEALEFQNYNGTVLSNGKVAVFYIGRTRLADIFNDIEGLSPAENPRVLDNLGMGPIYVNPAFDYEMVVYDAYDNELFSVKKYVLSKGEHSTANVVVTPSEHIAVSAWTIGDVQVYMPYLVGEVGKTYEGILPIVVNNDVNRISAQHIPLGVQDPLYFVEDSETACIIGLSGGTVPEGTMNESAFGYQDGQITSYNGSAFSAGNSYEAGSYVDITNNTISVTGLQPEGDYAYNSALSSKLDVTALPQDLVHSGDLTAYYPIDNPSGFITGVDLTDYATTSQLDEKLDKSDSGNFYPMEGNPSGFLTAHQSLEGYATEQWVEDKGYITGIDIQESAGWNEATTVVNNNSAIWNNTTNVVSSNSAAWGSATPQIPVTGINGIKISESGDQVVFEVSGDYVTHDDLTGKQDSLTFSYKDTAISSIDNSALYDNSAHARITTLAGRISDLSSNKLDVTAFSDVSGTFLTAVDLTPYQTTAGMTAYQSAGDYLTTADSANFYTTANESGFITGVPAGTLNESAFEYDSNNKISGYNGSAFAGGGVSGTNVVFVPDFEGSPDGTFYSATISGDVIVTTGNYNEYGENIDPRNEYSLISVGTDIGNKLDKSTINGSNTLINHDGHFEVGEKAYRATGFIDGSAYEVDLYPDSLSVVFDSEEIESESHLYSAIVTVETTTTGDVPEDWHLISYENNSAILTRTFPADNIIEHIILSNWDGWNITNCDASATVYSALEIAPLAFKDEITGITYTTGTI